MASIIKRGTRYRVQVRRAGTNVCKTFSNKRDADAWAASIERRAEEIAAHGYVTPRAATIAELIDAFGAAGKMKNASPLVILTMTDAS